MSQATITQSSYETSFAELMERVQADSELQKKFQKNPIPLLKDAGIPLLASVSMSVEEQQAFKDVDYSEGIGMLAAASR
jgi:hypothetical protein